MDSPGKKKHDLKELTDRFYLGWKLDWANQFNGLTFSPSTSILIKEDLKQLVYHHTQMCSTDDGEVGEGIAIAIEGKTDINAYYGFSMVAT